MDPELPAEWELPRGEGEECGRFFGSDLVVRLPDPPGGQLRHRTVLYRVLEDGMVVEAGDPRGADPAGVIRVDAADVVAVGRVVDRHLHPPPEMTRAGDFPADPGGVPMIGGFVQSDWRQVLTELRLGHSAREVHTDAVNAAARTGRPVSLEVLADLNLELPAGHVRCGPFAIAPAGQIRYESGPLPVDYPVWAAQNGVPAPLDDHGRLRYPHGISKTEWRRIRRHLAERSDAMDRGQSTYDQLVENGVLRPLTEGERDLGTALGHPDNESTQAAQRIAAKRFLRQRAAGTLPELSRARRVAVLLGLNRLVGETAESLRLELEPADVLLDLPDDELEHRRQNLLTLYDVARNPPAPAPPTGGRTASPYQREVAQAMGLPAGHFASAPSPEWTAADLSYRAKREGCSGGQLAEQVLYFRREGLGLVCCAPAVGTYRFIGEDARCAALVLGGEHLSVQQGRWILDVPPERIAGARQRLAAAGAAVVTLPDGAVLERTAQSLQTKLVELLPRSLSEDSLQRFFAAMDRQHFDAAQGVWAEPYGTCTYLNAAPALDLVDAGFTVRMMGFASEACPSRLRAAGLTEGHDFLVAEKDGLRFVVDPWKQAYLGGDTAQGVPGALTAHPAEIALLYGPPSSWREVWADRNLQDGGWAQRLERIFGDWRLFAIEESLCVAAPTRREPAVAARAGQMSFGF
jgi:hypothetical protein